jgi:hypothetical protein
MHTFDHVSLLAGAGIVSDQWVDRHGDATNVVKTAGNVVKSVVKRVIGAGRARRCFRVDRRASSAADISERLTARGGAAKVR